MSNLLPTSYQQFIHTSRYAKWLEEYKRRETWAESVARYFDFMAHHLKETLGYMLPIDLRNELEEAVLALEILPSMRALMTAGPALAKNHIAAYNCSYLPLDSLEAFSEGLLILCHGTGLGFSSERRYVSQLPCLPRTFVHTDHVIVVEDSKEGWQAAFRELLDELAHGRVPKWDMSLVRPKGARLKTFGGRASGPEPLVELFEYAVRLFTKAAGRKLLSIEAHDLMCKVAEIVVVGGVRRSALIGLSDVDDDLLRHAKSGAWWEEHPERALANNSIAFDSRPTVDVFMREWLALYESKSGERGLFNRDAARKAAARAGRRVIGYTEAGVPVTQMTEPGTTWILFGTNPCSEITLRPYQFCNLTSVTARASDNVTQLEHKIRLATILGTFQSTLTNIRDIRKVWKDNTEEERLLGVSLSGIMDCPLLNNPDDIYLPDRLEYLREIAVATNAAYADMLGIPRSAAITCVKPEGTSSQLVDSASGIHARYAPFYIRRVRGDNKDPLTQFLTLAGIPAEPDVMKPADMTVFSFPQAAPFGAVTGEERNAVQQLKLWLMFQRHYCEHKPSITVTVKEHEWPEVGAYVWEHFDELSGVSFLPDAGGHTYKQAPYEAITKELYEELKAKMPKHIDWSLLAMFEKEDSTNGTQTLACSAGACEVVDI